MMFARTSSFFILAAALAGCSQAPGASPKETGIESPAVSEIAVSYDKLRQITKQPVFVNPELAMLCRGASQQQVEAARAKHGPHANTQILVYMNDPAAEAFGSSVHPFPVGAVIVKKKIMLSYRSNDGKQVLGTGHGVGGMVKRSPGYDPSHGDWEYFYFDKPSAIESGKISSCIQCHEGAKNADYVFGTWQPKS